MTTEMKDLSQAMKTPQFWQIIKVFSKTTKTFLLSWIIQMIKTLANDKLVSPSFFPNFLKQNQQWTYMTSFLHEVDYSDWSPPPNYCHRKHGYHRKFHSWILSSKIYLNQAFVVSNSDSRKWGNPCSLYPTTTWYWCPLFQLVKMGWWSILMANQGGSNSESETWLRHPCPLDQLYFLMELSYPPFKKANALKDD